MDYSLQRAIFNGMVYTYFFDENGQPLTDYYLDSGIDITIKFADTVTEIKNVTLVVTYIPSDSNKIFYKTFENVTMVPKT